MSAQSNISIPWVEKYRPNSFDAIVLNKVNKTICNNIIETEKLISLAKWQKHLTVL